MEVQNLDLILLEREHAYRIRLAEADLADLPAYSFYLNPQAFYQKRWLDNSVQHPPADLAQLYLDSIRRITGFVQEILPAKIQKGKLYRVLADVPFQFVSKQAYEKTKPSIEKEKDSDAEIIPAAHYDVNDGIFVSLQENPYYIQGSIIHEHGHYLHDKFYPQMYRKCDPTMKELIAIYIQEECGFPRDYRENTPHHRAREILQRCREHGQLKGKAPASFWDVLIRFKDHEDLCRRL